MDSETAEEIKRHFNVVAESLRSDIRAMAEGLSANTDRLDRVHSRLDGIDDRLDGIDDRLDLLETRFDRFESRVSVEFTETRVMIRLSSASSNVESNVSRGTALEKPFEGARL